MIISVIIVINNQLLTESDKLKENVEHEKPQVEVMEM